MPWVLGRAGGWDELTSSKHSQRLDLGARRRSWAHADGGNLEARPRRCLVVEVMGLEPTNLLTASQALYQLSYTPAHAVV